MLRSIGLLACLLAASSRALDCVQIPDTSVRPGHMAFLPDSYRTTTGPVTIPPNWSCTYSIKVPEMMWAHVTVDNQLKGGNDMITAIDGVGLKKTILSSRNQGRTSFYVFPNTTTTLQVVTKSVDVRSAFGITVFFQTMPSPVVSQIGNTDLTYFLLNDLQINSAKNKPQNVQSDDKIMVTIAESKWSSDVFDNYFLVDGDFSAHKSVRRMTAGTSFAMGSNVTVVGLDNRVSESAVLFSRLSDTRQYDNFSGLTANFEERSLVYSSGLGGRGTVTFVSRDTDSVTFEQFGMAGCTHGTAQAVTTPVTNSSQVLFDFSKITSFPYTVNRKTFGIIFENCDVGMTFTSQK